MHRRRYVQLAGGAIAAGLAGCVGGDDDADDGDEGEDDRIDHPEDYPDDVDEGEVNGTNDEGYETRVVNGISVPLAPIEDVKAWYDAGEIVIADTMTEEQYTDLRIQDAVFSPAPDGLESGDPLETLAADTHIVTYCVCPNTMAANRAAVLMQDGYDNIYALREGLQDWVERGYPVAGSQA